MKKYYIRTLIIASLLSTSLVHSQSLKEKTADKYYNVLSYAKAVEYYKELANEKNASIKNIRRAADCYRKINDLKNASKYYDKLVNTSGATNEDFYNYCQVLKTLGKYEKASEYLQLIHSSNAYPIVLKRHTDNKDYYLNLKRDSALYTIKDAGFNSEESDFSPFINKGDIYFTSSRRNVSGVNKTFAWDDSYFLDEYIGKFEDGKFTNISSLLKDKDSKYHEGPAIVSEDGNTLYITRSNYIDRKSGKNTKRQINLKIYIAKKDEKGNWGKFENFPFNNDEYSVGHPALSKNGEIMYFVSDMPGGYGQTDIYQTHKENGVWSKPTNLGQAINSEGKEMFPSVNNDILFFSSDGNAGLGGLDIYFASPQRDKSFSSQNLGYPINTQYDDFGIFINDDLLSGFVSSNRVGGKGKDDIYLFACSVPILNTIEVDGNVYDNYSNASIDNVKIEVFDSFGNLMLINKTNELGKFKFNLLAGDSYKLVASKDDYENFMVTLKSIDSSDKSLHIDVNLESKGVYALSGIVTDATTKKPLNNVAVLIKDKKTGQEVLKALTTNAGDFEKLLGKLKGGDLLDYDIQLQKDGYSSKTVTFIQTLGKPGIIKINELFDISLTPNSSMAEGDLFSINPIFFDLDQSEIRSDAQSELDKLVETLKSRKDFKIEITSTTDCRATNSYNMNLSKRRATATANYLVSKGINKNRLKLKWTGENNLTTNCPCEPTNESGCSEDQHQQNRKSSFRVVNYTADLKKINNIE